MQFEDKNKIIRIILIIILSSELIQSFKSQDTEENYFSEEIKEKYGEYTLLEDHDKTCNYENLINSSNEENIKNKITENSISKNCVPDIKSFVSILENGWKELAEYLVTEIYLQKMVDPSQTILSYTNKSDTKLKYLVQFVNEFSKSTKLIPKYTYENFDDKIKFNVVLPDASYNPEYVSVFCYKDSFKINSILKTKNKIFRIYESKQFYDQIVGDCEYTFNSFSNQLELSFNKLNKMKKWEKLFK